MELGQRNNKTEANSRSADEAALGEIISPQPPFRDSKCHHHVNYRRCRVRRDRCSCYTTNSKPQEGFLLVDSLHDWVFWQRKPRDGQTIGYAAPAMHV